MQGTIRFHVSKSAHAYYSNLKKGDNPLFKQMSDMFYWCVILGYKSGRKRVKLDQKKDVFQWSAFSDTQKTMLEAIAVAGYGDYSLLGNLDNDSEETSRDILEELADIGFTSLLNIISDVDKNIESNCEKLFSQIVEHIGATASE